MDNDAQAIVIRYTDGRGDIELSQQEADEILNGPNVSGPSCFPVRVAGSDDRDEIHAEAYEVYAEGETEEDYPDGDLYAPTIVILPHNYAWTRDGRSAVKHAS